jgi:hypothetical protein
MMRNQDDSDETDGERNDDDDNDESAGIRVTIPKTVSSKRH